MPKKQRRDPIDMHAAGVRDGTALERIGTVARLRIWGLEELASALERDDGFAFAVAAHRLSLVLPRPPREKVSADDRQVGLFDEAAIAAPARKATFKKGARVRLVDGGNLGRVRMRWDSTGGLFVDFDDNSGCVCQPEELELVQSTRVTKKALGKKRRASK